MDHEDAALVSAFKRGEESAFTALVIKYRETVYRFARRFVANHEDAADISQETFIRVYRALARFDGRAHLRTWLYRITVNLCLDHQDRRRRFPLLASDSVDETGGTAAGAWETELAAPEEEGPEMQAEASATREAVAHAVAALSPRQRAMVVLRIYQDFPYADIAQVMGCAEGTVKATMFAALRKLRAALAGEVGGRAVGSRKEEREQR